MGKTMSACRRAVTAAIMTPMADPSRSPERPGNGKDDREPDYAGTPTWVKVFIIIGGILALLFIALHLMGRGFGGHGH